MSLNTWHFQTEDSAILGPKIQKIKGALRTVWFSVYDSTMSQHTNKETARRRSFTKSSVMTQNNKQSLHPFASPPPPAQISRHYPRPPLSPPASGAQTSLQP